jgi:Glycine cleavage system T protein (aminomethyltransferase)
VPAAGRVHRRRLKAYREWLPANGYEATGSLGGSFYSDDISDYYLTPHDLGYWPFVKFDHDFIGREALEAMADEPKRRKVTLAWNGEDVAAAMGSMFEKGDAVKYIDLPLSNYSTWPNDKLLIDGEQVGVSSFSGYSYNERSMLSLGCVDVDVEVGTEVVLVWGEENRGSSKPVVERHQAGRDPRDRQPGSVLRGPAHDVRGRLATEAKV